MYCVWLSDGKLTYIKYLPKKIALLVQKLCGKKICQNLFPGFFKRKKKLFCPLSRGGGVAKDLIGLSTKKELFFLREAAKEQTTLVFPIFIQYCQIFKCYRVVRVL